MPKSVIIALLITFGMAASILQAKEAKELATRATAYENHLTPRTKKA